MSKKAFFDENGKMCSSCQKYKEYSEFYKSKDKKSHHKSHCKDCTRKRSREYYWTPEGRKYRQEKTWRENGIKGMTVKKYEELLAYQNGKCAICERTENKNGTRLCVDHNHETGEIRGLLCHYCNVSLGRMGDSLDRLYKAVSYLEEYEWEKL